MSKQNKIPQATPAVRNLKNGSKAGTGAVHQAPAVKQHVRKHGTGAVHQAPAVKKHLQG